MTRKELTAQYFLRICFLHFYSHMNNISTHKDEIFYAKYNDISKEFGLMNDFARYIDNEI